MTPTHQPKPMSLSIRLYRLLLIAYPRDHRQTYGPLMLQAFRDQYRSASAHGTLAVVTLWWRTLADLIVTAAREHLAHWHGSLRVSNHPAASLPPRQVLLALLPGLVYIGGTVYGTLSNFAYATLYRDGAVFALCAVLALAGWLQQRRSLPRWTLMPIGVGLCSGLQLSGVMPLLPIAFLVAIIIGAVWTIRQRRALHLVPPARMALRLIVGVVVLNVICVALQTPHFLMEMPILMMGTLMVVLYGILLLPAGILLPWARRDGIAVALVFAGLQYLVVMVYLEPDYALGMWMSSPAIIAMLKVLPALFFLLATPALVLRARTTHGQMRGLLAATGFGLLAAVCVPLAKSLSSPDYPWSTATLLLRSSIGLGFFVTMLSAALACHEVRHAGADGDIAALHA
ncbi:MAG: DUF3488 domain-containing protein [Chloroflexi bacterium]|nr:DUF3488 domain-containing protein [Chloroflexota bacterium]